MSNVDAELVAEFVVESQEGLANIEQQMLAIEAAGGDMDVELVNAVFRTMHTIKGSSGFLGLDRIGALAHGLEEVLNGMRNREIPTSSELVTTILRASDYMKGMLDAIDSSNNVDIDEYVHELHQFRPGNDHAAQAASAATAAGSIPSVTAPQSALHEFLGECHENLDNMDQELLCLEQSPNSPQIVRILFRVMHTINIGSGFLGLRSLESLAGAAERLLARLRDGGVVVSPEVLSALMAAVDSCRQALRSVEASGTDQGIEVAALIERLQNVGCANETPVPAAFSAVNEATLPAAEIKPPSAKQQIPAAESNAAEKSNSNAGDTTIRVDVGLLDKLMTRVGELVLARNQIVQFTGKMEDAAFASTAQRLNLITTELQESVMKTRMQPIGNVWAKFPRVVRDLAGQLGKDVRIEMEGKDTELDKTIVEAIKDPLTHLVRNSIDHGIESPAVRKAAGKPEQGCLTLRAYHEGGQVNIEISDDGAGLNLERIRKKSVERGLVSADQAARLSDRELSQMIFAAGFSTAEQVTSVSGRGVGMDVVRTNIERIGGIIDLQSAPGEGTTVKIKIPLTLAIIPALIVTTAGDRYAIPQINLLELLRLEGSDAQRSIEYIHGAPVYRLRGKLLPLVYLSERLGLVTGDIRLRQEQADAACNIVVLRADDRQFGLIVDKVSDTEEIVVKPLGKQLKKIGEYAGTTIMGDGGVALILDVKGLAVASGLSGELRSRSGAEESLESQRHRQSFQSVLLVDVGDARRFALPISMVSRLEKIPTSKLELANGREVIQYRGKILQLLRLDEIVGAANTANPSPDELQVVVYDQQGHSFGLVVRRILDTCEVTQQTTANEQSAPHLLGTLVIQQHVTDVVDMQEISKRLRTPSLQTSI